MDKFFRPFPFNGELKSYPKEYIEMVVNKNLKEDELLPIIQKKSKSIEEFYPSISQMYDNLILYLKDKYDKNICNKYVTEPILCQEFIYDNRYPTDVLNNVPPTDDNNNLQDNNEVNYSNFATLGLSPRSEPLLKLDIISKLIDFQKPFEIVGKITKDIINEKGQNNSEEVCSIQKFEDHNIEKWLTSDVIRDLISKSKNSTIYINSLNGSYIVYKNSKQQITIIDIKSQKIISNEGSEDVKNIFKAMSDSSNSFHLVNAAIINHCLTIIGIRDMNCFIIQYRDDEMKNLDSVPYICIATGIKLRDSEFCCQFINNELHLYTNNNKIVVYDLKIMKTIDKSPQKYFFSYENITDDRIFSISFDNDKTLYIDTKKIKIANNYITLIRPSYAKGSYQTISMISDDILTNITNTLFEISINGKNIDGQYVSKPNEHIKLAISILLDLHKVPNNLKEFINIFLARFIVLNLRQVFYQNQTIQETEKAQIITLFNDMPPTKPVLDTYDIIIKTVKFGIYWPEFVDLINEHFLKQESTPKSILFKLEQSIFLPFNLTDLDGFNDDPKNIKFIKERIFDMYVLVKKSENVLNYDEEFVYFINLVFQYVISIYRNENLLKCLDILKELLAILMIIPIGPNLALCIYTNLKEISQENMIYKILLVDKDFNDLMVYFKNYAFYEELENIPSIILKTSIFAPKNMGKEIETSLNSPFIKINVTQKYFEKDKENKIATFNEKNLSTQQQTTAFDGNDFKIHIKGSNENTQYILEGVISKEQCDVCELNKINEDVGKLVLLPFLYLKLSESIEYFEDVIYMEPLQNNRFHDKLIDLLKNGLSDKIPKIISQFTIRKPLRNRQFRDEIQLPCVKIVISILWLCNFENEFNDFESDQTIGKFERLFKDKFMKQINEFQNKLREKSSKEKEYKDVKKVIDSKFDILMNSNCLQDKTKRDEWIKKIFEFYDLRVTLNQIARKKKVIPLCKHISETYELTFGFISKQLELYRNPLKKGTKKIFIPLVRAFVQNIDPFYNKKTFKKKDFQNICMEFDDPLINIHLILLEKSPIEMKNIAKYFQNDYTFSDFFNSLSILYKMCHHISPPLTAKYDKSHIFAAPGYIACNGGYYWEVAKCVEQMRKDFSPSKICQEIEFKKHKLSYSTIGAMIGLGAQIFDSEITRYIIDKGEIKEAANYRFNDQEGFESSFSVPPPQFEITENFMGKIKKIIHLIDLDTKDPHIAVQNCIILSFVTKYEKNVSKSNLSMLINSETLKYFCKKIEKIKNNPSNSNSKFSYLIRQKLKSFAAMKTEDEFKKEDRFIPLTEFTSCDEKIIAGSQYTQSWFVHTKQLEKDESIKFKLSKQKNTLKYIGFITDKWDVILLSLFDMNIYSENKFTKYINKQSKVVLANDDNWVQFGDVKIIDIEPAKRWVFIITVCDHSRIKYKITKNTRSTAEVATLEEHNFDVREIFPQICLGKKVSLPDHSNMIVSQILDGHKYRIEGTNNSYNCFVQYDVSESQFKTDYTRFGILMNNAELSYHIGNRNNILNDLLSTCNNYSMSLLKELYDKLSITPKSIIGKIASLKSSSSEKEVKEVNDLILQSNLRDEILQNIVDGVQNIENDSNISQFKDFEELNNCKLGYFQKALFQSWYHNIFYNNTFLNGLILFNKYKKSCIHYIPLIMDKFSKEKYSPDTLEPEDAKMILEFFNTSRFYTFMNLNIEEHKDYFNKLVTIVFQRYPDAIVQEQNHSKLINDCAELYINDLFQLGQESMNGETRMPLLLLYSDKGAKFRKFVPPDKSFYPIEILRDNDKKEVLESGSKIPNDCKGYRYHFGRQGRRVLTDWCNYKDKDFKPLYNKLLLHYILKNKIAEYSIDGYPAIVLYFVNIGLSTRQIDYDLFDINSDEVKKLYNYVSNNLIGTYVSLGVNRENTLSRGKDVNDPNFTTIFAALVNSQFPLKLRSRNEIYSIYYENESAIDVGGVFRDSFNNIVNELMDTRLAFFEEKPASLLCESDCLVPSKSLNQKQAETIGALISSAIATKNYHRKWNLPLFIWDFFVTDADLEYLVDYTDKIYFDSLKEVVKNMRKGFRKVLPLNEVCNLSGMFLKILACGKSNKLDLQSFLELFDYDAKNTTVWPTFTNAIKNFDSEQFHALLKFITGLETPGDKKIRIRMIASSTNDENNFSLPKAHTCFHSVEFMPYKNPEILRNKLLIIVNDHSAMEE